MDVPSLRLSFPVFRQDQQADQSQHHDRDDVSCSLARDDASLPSLVRGAGNKDTLSFLFVSSERACEFL